MALRITELIVELDVCLLLTKVCRGHLVVWRGFQHLIVKTLFDTSYFLLSRSRLCRFKKCTMLLFPCFVYV